ncbi:extracellular catalytic domain type 1 short-chain-length polyhydroxyalkanoate depolymerase [Humitalea sp. 24SJ18S-53]|uniref:extracellular catalytic domain type 1 short-chain-length polyhydroxyalkanoate depolymerase n=1 Tax=Humitalea sp. 24SJ18S-53 TaxID=3422307 RepID=UPI003D6712FE
MIWTRKPSSAAGMLSSFGRVATRLASLAWAPPPKPLRAPPRAVPKASIPPGRITEIPAFGSNPGGLRMLVYAPARPPRPGAPLIVVLHGCRQGAEAFATDAGWLALADRLRIPLLLPEQSTLNNRHRCFNWYRPSDTGRGGGEAMSIRQMVRAATRHFGTDRRRLFIVGLSAGGAMAVAMLAAYPAVFAGGACVAGMPAGTASSGPMALLRMHRADPYRSRAGLVAAVHASAPPRGKQPWPRLSIWQGEQDRTVNPANAEVLAAQWSGLHGLDPDPATDAAVAPGIRRRTWGRAARPAVELWTIAGLGHGFPIQQAAPGGGRPGPWVLEAGLPAARHIAAFWGIDPAMG